jgi:hypothetical protein
VPKSSGVYKLQELIGNKPSIVILNKADLAAPNSTQVLPLKRRSQKLLALLQARHISSDMAGADADAMLCRSGFMSCRRLTMQSLQPAAQAKTPASIR